MSPELVKAGYKVRNESFDRFFNIAIALPLLLAAAPVILLISILVKVVDGGDIFYRGERLGKDRRPFQILKFRTLELQSAQQLTSDRTLPRRSTAETRIGRYLRKTRLDELPQIINVLRGEMSIYGPRPVRPEIAEIYGVIVPDYDRRFEVRPGLVGLTQALMSHETSKEIRARFNNLGCRADVRYLQTLLFMSRVGLAVLRKTVAEVAARLLRGVQSDHGLGIIESGFTLPARCSISFLRNGVPVTGVVVGMSDEIIQFVLTRPVSDGSMDAEIVNHMRRGRKVIVRLRLDILSTVPAGIGRPGHIHCAAYRTPSNYTAYRIERYFLRAPVLAGA
jgi:lipopolysaccharide/colanic/teichoic acid biosynthesis glycosyltransferase